MPTIPDPIIIRSKRSSLSLEINPKAQLVVKAPYYMPMFLINQFIKSKQEWILENIQKVSKRLVKDKHYVEGEEFMYLGILYPLHIGDFKEIGVSKTLNFPKFLLFRAQKEMAEWYKKQAKEIITRRVEINAEKMHAHYTYIYFSDTKSKWGTCGPENDLQFNWRLVMAPLVVLDYVVIHELAHTKEKNHGKNFWNIVGKYTPAFKSHRKWLHAHAHLLTY